MVGGLGPTRGDLMAGSQDRPDAQLRRMHLSQAPLDHPDRQARVLTQCDDQ
jgi:hypothetical protein